MNNIRESEFNKNVIQVYTQESGFTGYKGFEFNKIDDIEDILKSGVTAKTEKSSTISNSTPASSNGTVLNANANRLELYVQNLATGALYVKYGADASNSSFNFVLAANTATNAGDGGSLSDQSYTGIVSVSGDILNYISWERS